MHLGDCIAPPCAFLVRPRCLCYVNDAETTKECEQELIEKHAGECENKNDEEPGHRRRGERQLDRGLPQERPRRLLPVDPRRPEEVADESGVANARNFDRDPLPVAEPVVRIAAQYPRQRVCIREIVPQVRGPAGGQRGDPDAVRVPPYLEVAVCRGWKPLLSRNAV